MAMLAVSKILTYWSHKFSRYTNLIQFYLNITWFQSLDLRVKSCALHNMDIGGVFNK